jgi:hypothetical protein
MYYVEFIQTSPVVPIKSSIIITPLWARVQLRIRHCFVVIRSDEIIR